MTRANGKKRETKARETALTTLPAERMESFEELAIRIQEGKACAECGLPEEDHLQGGYWRSPDHLYMRPKAR